MNKQQYDDEVHLLASSIAKKVVLEMGLDLELSVQYAKSTMLHEVINEHDFLKTKDDVHAIREYTNNTSYYLTIATDDYLLNILDEKGVGGLYEMMAYWSFYADVLEEIGHCADVEIDRIIKEKVDSVFEK